MSINDTQVEITGNDLSPPKLVNIPAWLNEKFIAKVLKKHFADQPDIKVERLVINLLGGNGESYASLMFRVIVLYSIENHSNEKRTMNFIVKTLPTFEMALEKLGSDNYNVHNKEMEMYQNLLPKMKELLSNARECPNFSPICYGIEKNFDVIVLEDLSEKKFVVADRIQQLNFEHITLGLRKLARFHAASAFMYQQNPQDFDLFRSGYFTRETDVLHVMCESLCDAFNDEVAKWEGFEYYAMKMKNVRKNLIKHAQRAFDCDADDFLVLNHGDMWTTNLMFNYNEHGQPVDVKFIDFQFSHIGSPALDLIYFLFSSSTDNIRQHKIEERVQFYYNELKEVLIRLNFDMKNFPTLHAFQLQVRKKYFYALTTCLLILPIHLSNDKDMNFECLQGTDERSMACKRRIMQNPKYLSIVKKILAMFDRIGLLDEM